MQTSRVIPVVSISDSSLKFSGRLTSYTTITEISSKDL